MSRTCRAMSRVRRMVAAVAGCIVLTAGVTAPPIAAGFPVQDRRFHTYDEMQDALAAAERDHPDIVRRFSIGRSWEGRELWAVEISDNVGEDEGEPEVLLDGLHHGREHLSAEMALAVLRWLTEGHGSDDRITRIVETRRIWIVPMVNPDGGEHDIAGDGYAGWRRNRQPTPGTGLVGTDVNRNYGFKWACCGGASRDPADGMFAGTRAFSAPEARAMRDLVAGRVVDGRQRIRTAISFHTQGRLVMYPYGYTRVDVPPRMTTLDHRTFVALAQEMAASNGYRAQQASELYVSSGTFASWLHARYRVFSFVVELATRHDPADERIASETGRNREAVLRLLERAGCPYAAAGAARTACGPLFDDLEIDRGWRLDPDGTDTATAGTWGRGVPAGSGLQLGDAIDGRAILVTGRTAGVDVDDGRTTIRSPRFLVPEAGAELRLWWWLGLDAAAGPTDGLTIVAVDGAGSPIGDPLLEVVGDGTQRTPAWRRLRVTLPDAAAGQLISLQLIARDAPGDGDAIVEAGVDAIRVVAR